MNKETADFRLAQHVANGAAARALAVKMGRSDALLTAVDCPRGGLFAVE